MKESKNFQPYIIKASIYISTQHFKKTVGEIYFGSVDSAVDYFLDSFVGILSDDIIINYHLYDSKLNLIVESVNINTDFF